MGVPVIYRKSPEGAIATYDFFDIANGTGVIQLYGALDQSSSGVLTSENVYSNDVSSDITANSSGSFTKQIDIDFDVVITNPTTFKGTFYANVPFYLQYAGVGQTIQNYVVVNFSKYDGSTETLIATGTSRTATESNSTMDQSMIYMVKAAIPTTNFKSGETLRITVESWYKTITGSLKCGIGHDPKGRLDPIYSAAGYNYSSTNTMIFNIPVRIDL